MDTRPIRRVQGQRSLVLSDPTLCYPVRSRFYRDRGGRGFGSENDTQRYQKTGSSVHVNQFTVPGLVPGPSLSIRSSSLSRATSRGTPTLPRPGLVGGLLLS